MFCVPILACHSLGLQYGCPGRWSTNGSRLVRHQDGSSKPFKLYGRSISCITRTTSQRSSRTLHSWLLVEIFSDTVILQMLLRRGGRGDSRRCVQRFAVAAAASPSSCCLPWLHLELDTSIITTFLQGPGSRSRGHSRRRVQRPAAAGGLPGRAVVGFCGSQRAQRLRQRAERSPAAAASTSGLLRLAAYPDTPSCVAAAVSVEQNTLAGTGGASGVCAAAGCLPGSP